MILFSHISGRTLALGRQVEWRGLAMAAEELERFAQTGFFGPVRVLSTEECRTFLDEVDASAPRPLGWKKGAAATSSAYYRIATRPEIIEVVSELLGGEVMLWGASLIERDPDQKHPWHTDIESSAPDGTTASVWIGLENATAESSLLVVSRSHRLGLTVQEARHGRGIAREEADADDILLLAREHDGRAQIINTRAGDGDALFFDGRLWHGTHNVSGRTRRALLLQYATSGTAIRVPDLGQPNWPFRMLDQPRPPCLLVRGSASPDSNRLVPGPAAEGTSSQGRPLTSRIQQLRLPLEVDEKRGWRPHPLFSGRTANLPALSCHASALLHGRSPHPPHTHAEEELLLVLAGEVEVDLPSAEAAMRLQPGEFVYYPEGFAHTLRTTSGETANYVMLKWRGEQGAEAAALPFGRFRTAAAGVLFEGPTEYLRKLHAHVTLLEPGSGYEPHVDAYDVAIVLLDGEVETIGGRVTPHDVVFYRAGEAHGMRCLGDAPARYLVFEFHGRTWLGTGQLRDPRLRAKLGMVLGRARAAQRRRAGSLRLPKRRPPAAAA